MYLYLDFEVSPVHSVILLCNQTQLSLTCPWGFNNPLIEEDEFPFAVVDGGLAIYIADICDFAWAFFTLYTNPKKEVIYYILRPACDISLCPVRRLRKLNNQKHSLFYRSCLWFMFQENYATISCSFSEFYREVNQTDR